MTSICLEYIKSRSIKNIPQNVEQTKIPVGNTRDVYIKFKTLLRILGLPLFEPLIKISIKALSKQSTWVSNN